MVQKNTKSDMLSKLKKYSKNDTSYSSIWKYVAKSEFTKEIYKDYFTTFYDDKNMLSTFSPVMAKNIINFWSEKNDIILDPFSGRTRAIMANALERNYIGYEVSKDVTDYMTDRLSKIKLTTNIKILNKDCATLGEELKGSVVDLIFTCPPYWNLEKYQSCPGQLSDYTNYKHFLMALHERLTEALKTLKSQKYMCVVVGDFRYNKQYIPFHNDLIQTMKANENIDLHDVVVLQNIPFNTAAFYFGSKKKHKYTAKAHEYLIVWKKK
jgi:DNA modification methylase